MLDEVLDASYGPFRFDVTAAAVKGFVEATGDDADRWTDYGPPSLAGALLFAVTPALLADERLDTASVIHGDQSFVWHRSLDLGMSLGITGRVTKARERGGVYFVGFDFVASDGEGAVVEGASTFLMAGDTAPGAGAADDPEPAALVGSDLAPPPRLPLPPPGEEIPPLDRSASRADLVRYAAASRDFNPIHWDHVAAVDAGLSGIVVHGLLQSAWILQSAAGYSPGPAPLVSARFRYRSPLRPAVSVRVTGVHNGDGAFEMRLEDSAVSFVTANVQVRN